MSLVCDVIREGPPPWQVSRSFGDFSFKTAAGKPEDQKLSVEPDVCPQKGPSGAMDDLQF